MTGVSIGSARLPACPMGTGWLAARWMGELPPSLGTVPDSRSICTSLAALSVGRNCSTAAAAAPGAPPGPLSALGEWGPGAGLLPAVAKLPSDALLGRRSSGWSSGVGMRSAKSPPSAGDKDAAGDEHKLLRRKAAER